MKSQDVTCYKKRTASISPESTKIPSYERHYRN